MGKTFKNKKSRFDDDYDNDYRQMSKDKKDRMTEMRRDKKSKRSYNDSNLEYDDSDYS